MADRILGRALQYQIVLAGKGGNVSYDQREGLFSVSHPRRKGTLCFSNGDMAKATKHRMRLKLPSVDIFTAAFWARLRHGDSFSL